MTEQERDQEPADAAISVEKRVNRFELHVREASANEHGQAVVRR